MLRRPSARRKSGHQELNLNLVPMLDALVTMVAFLMLTMGYLAISAIETPAPMLAPPEEQRKELEKKKEPPLQLTAELLPDSRILLHDWMGSRVNYTIEAKDDPEKPGEKTFDVEEFHKKIISLKEKWPDENQLILKPSKGVPYASLVLIMDAGRYYTKTDEVSEELKQKQAASRQEAIAKLEAAKAQGKPLALTVPGENELFSNVIFGNILSDE